MTLLGSAANHLQPLTTLDQQGIAIGLIILREQLGHRHSQHITQPAQGIQAGGNLRIFYLAQHALADPRDPRHISQFQGLGLALTLDLQA
ncbi:hypothetical protein D3C76_1595500 [compost metagenome]